MKNIVPRVAAIHDISGFGRCSLTVIIPVLSCMGVQVCPLPTAVLSTHTGGFKEMAFNDLTESMDAYINHWKKLNLSFEYVYTGFLGNEQQIDKVADFCESFERTGGECVVVDPVMGENGRLYSTYNEIMQQKMKNLVMHADIITPNLTEMYFLLDEQYKAEPLSDREIKERLQVLGALGPKIVIVTGVPTEDGRKANIAYDSIQEVFWKVAYDEIPVSYPGTGDIFTSVLIGGLSQGDSLPMAISRATNFISLAIKTTYGYCTPAREGVMLEKVLPALFSKEMIGEYTMLE